MKRLLYVLLGLVLIGAGYACTCGEPIISVEHDGDKAVVTIDGRCRYLMLPVQEGSWEVRVRAVDAASDVPQMDIRLAADTIDYYVPFELPKVKGVRKIAFDGLWPGAVCWKNLKTANSIDLENTEYYRPVYHHTPLTGWMNDPNGMVYKDGTYHLYYQYNPYGSRWGNMHWGHSTSKDLVNWEHHPVAISRDTLGHIYSGSAVIDKNNTAGFGENALIAIYTAHNGPVETQCIAYSTDEGLTFTKYEGNPVVTAADGIRDFRDPKVFWYEPEEKWVMILAANYEVRFYDSKNLRDWQYTGCFGKGYGAQPSLFECPDIFQLASKEDPQLKKWVLLVNINPGGVFGGSATEYFVGNFDGKTFVCDTEPKVVKWLDYGKDHYAAVTFSNTGDQVIAMAWMSNWQYADAVPTTQFRSANSIARDLSLFESDGDYFVSSTPVEQMQSLRKSIIISNNTLDSKELNIGHSSAKEISFRLTPDSEKLCNITLSNELGEKVDMTFDFVGSEVSVDRSKSGKMVERDDFSTLVKAPLSLCKSKEGYDVTIYLDKASMEIFVDNGRIAITELIFPTEPYSRILFKENMQITDINIYNLE